MTPPTLLPEAEEELREAALWYESERPGLGLALVADLDASLQGIAENPAFSPVWPPAPRFRRALLRRFPYAVFYHLRSAGPEVVAFAHCSRRPGYWLHRLEP